MTEGEFKAHPSKGDDETLRAIMRGELTIEAAVSSKKLTLKQISDFQEQFLVKPESRPWERVLDRIWKFGTQGRLKWLTMPVFLVFIFLPATASLYESGVKLTKAFASYLQPAESEMSASEIDVCNEWVARVSSHSKQEDALRTKEEVLRAIRGVGKATWLEAVHVVRDVETEGTFLTVVDICGGPASLEVIQRELQAFSPSSPDPSVRALANLLQAARPLYYSESSFEEKNGRRSPSSRTCQSEEIPFGATGVTKCF